MRPNISIVTYDLDGRFIRKTTKLAKAISTSEYQILVLAMERSSLVAKKILSGQVMCKNTRATMQNAKMQKFLCNNAKCKNAKIPVQGGAEV